MRCPYCHEEANFFTPPGHHEGSLDRQCAYCGAIYRLDNRVVDGDATKAAGGNHDR